MYTLILKTAGIKRCALCVSEFPRRPHLKIKVSFTIYSARHPHRPLPPTCIQTLIRGENLLTTNFLFFIKRELLKELRTLSYFIWKERAVKSEQRFRRHLKASWLWWFEKIVQMFVVPSPIFMFLFYNQQQRYICLFEQQRCSIWNYVDNPARNLFSFVFSKGVQFCAKNFHRFLSQLLLLTICFLSESVATDREVKSKRRSQNGVRQTKRFNLQPRAAFDRARISDEIIFSSCEKRK